MDKPTSDDYSQAVFIVVLGLTIGLWVGVIVWVLVAESILPQAIGALVILAFLVRAVARHVAKGRSQ